MLVLIRNSLRLLHIRRHFLLDKITVNLLNVKVGRSQFYYSMTVWIIQLVLFILSPYHGKCTDRKEMQVKKLHDPKNENVQSIKGNDFLFYQNLLKHHS